MNRKRSIKALEDATERFKKEQNKQAYAWTQTNLGSTYRNRAMEGIQVEENLTRSRERLQEAVQVFESQEDWQGYAWAQLELIRTYNLLGSLGVEREKNHRRSLKALEDIVQRIRERQNDPDYASIQLGIGGSYRMLAGPPGKVYEEYFSRSTESLEEAAPSIQKPGRLGRVCSGQEESRDHLSHARYERSAA